MRKSSIIIIGVFAGAIYWFVDALVDVFFFGNGAVAEQLFSPRPQEVWIRLFALVMLVSTPFFVWKALTKRKRAEDEPSGYTAISFTKRAFST